MLGIGHRGDWRAEKPNRGQWSKLDISNSRKPLPWARGTKGRRCRLEPRGCGHLMEAGTTVSPSGRSWKSHGGDAAMEEVPISDNWREYPWHTQTAGISTSSIQSREMARNGSENRQARTGTKSKFYFLITSIYWSCISLESRSLPHLRTPIPVFFLPWNDIQTSSQRMVWKPFYHCPNSPSLGAPWYVSWKCGTKRS